LLALLFIPAGSLAQNTPDTPDDWTKVTAVVPGDRLVVELKSGKREKGKLGAVSDSGLTLVNGKKTNDIPRDNVRKIHRVTGASVKKATLIGTASGAAGGAVIGAAAEGCDPSKEPICIIGPGSPAAVLGVIGAAVGALTGFLFGKLSHKEVLIYEDR
jgi:hypothetical protein